MHPAVKVLIGALMVVVGVYSSVTFWNDLLTIVKGGIGPLLVLIGAFIVWLESDEWKMQREESETVQQQFEPREEVMGETEEEEKTVEDEGHSCPECGKTFDTQRGMNIHRAQKHE